MQYGADESRRISFAASVLEGMGIVNKAGETEKDGIVYVGPDVYGDLVKEEFEDNRSEFNLKKVTIKLNTITILDEYQYDFEPPSYEMVRQKFAEFVNTDGMSEDKRRSIQNRNIVCRCGFKKTIEAYSHNGKVKRTKAAIGFKKRSRCKECAGCLAPKCMKCPHCLNPRMKQACVNKVCLFPKVPKCPCFA